MGAAFVRSCLPLRLRALLSGGAALSRAALPRRRARRAAIQSYKTLLIFCMASMSYKIWVLYGWFCPRCPCLWLWLLRSCRARPRRALRSHSPARPSPSGRLAGWGALAPCAGDPLGVFRPLRRAGARSGTAPSARSPRSGTLAALAVVAQRIIKKAPIRKVVQMIALEIPAGMPYNQNIPFPGMSKDTAQSGFFDRKPAKRRAFSLS